MPSDGGTTNVSDATVAGDSPSRQPDAAGGGDDSSPRDAGPAPLGVDASTSGDAGVAALCAGLCGALDHCVKALDAAAAPCHCGVNGTQLLRTDYVQGLTDCVSSKIAGNCSVVMVDGGADSVITACGKTVANTLNPTPTTAAFCKNLGLSMYCSTAIPDCVTQVFTYSDPTVTSAAQCLMDVPDAAVDGGCNAFAQCLNAAFTP